MRWRKKFRCAGLQRYFACGDDGVAQRPEYFALGFSLSEGIIESPRDTSAWMSFLPVMVLKYKLSFPSPLYGVEGASPGTGGTYGMCVCGVEQLNDIGKPVQPLPFTRRLISTNWMMHYVISMIFSSGATDRLYSRRRLDVAIWRTVGGHEDVGRHVALDKLLGRRHKKGKAGSKVRCWFPAVPV